MTSQAHSQNAHTETHNTNARTRHVPCTQHLITPTGGVCATKWQGSAAPNKTKAVAHAQRLKHNYRIPSRRAQQNRRAADSWLQTMHQATPRACTPLTRRLSWHPCSHVRGRHGERATLRKDKANALT